MKLECREPLWAGYDCECERSDFSATHKGTGWLMYKCDKCERGFIIYDNHTPQLHHDNYEYNIEEFMGVTLDLIMVLCLRFPVKLSRRID